MDRAHDWLGATAAVWNERKHSWSFPSGATLSFGYLETETRQVPLPVGRVSVHRLRRADRVWRNAVHLPLHPPATPGRLRDPAAYAQRLQPRRRRPRVGAGPLRRCRTDAGRIFIPARLEDNPHLDQEGYRESLNRLTPSTSAQLLEGDWQIRPEGAMFRRDWFAIVEQDRTSARACATGTRRPPRGRRPHGRRADREEQPGHLLRRGRGQGSLVGAAAAKRSCDRRPSETAPRSRSGSSRSPARGARSRPRPPCVTWPASGSTPIG